MECAQCGAALDEGRKNCAACGAPAAYQETGNSEEIHRSLAEANLLRIRKQHDEAINICTRVLRMDPSNATAHSLMGDIYRDEGNTREALGWYKLAVQLNPHNQADRKKLDETIDRVFQGAKQGEPHSFTVVEEETPFTTLPSPGFNLRSLLEKITPTHVIITFSVIALVVFLGVMFLPGRSKGKSTPAQAQPLPTTSTQAANPGGTPVLPPPGPMTAPPGDAVETPGGGTKIPNLPITVTPGDSGNAGNPANKTPGAASPGNDNKSGAVRRVPPLPIQVQQMTADELEKETQRIRTALENELKKSELQSTLNEVALDPRTKMLSVSYTIPHMYGPQETKQGLIYSGFILVWAADKANGIIRSYNLKGFAYKDKEKEPTLALVTDVTPQQADAAREAGDYKTAAKYMMNAWWRDDLSGVSL